MINYEEELLISCIHSKEWRKKFVESKLTRRDFENKFFGWIFDGFIKRIGEDTANFDMLQAVMSGDAEIKKNEDLATGITEAGITLFRTIQKRKKSESEVIYPHFSYEVSNLIRRKKRIKSLLMDTIKDVDDNRTPEEIFTSLKERVETVSTEFVSVDDYTPVEILSSFKQRYEQGKEEYDEGISFQFEDECLAKFYPLKIMAGESFGIMADTGVGKSIFVSNVAMQGIGKKNKLNVLMVVTENEVRQVSTRLDSIAFDESYAKIYSGALSQEEVEHFDNQYHSLLEEQGYGRLFVVSVIPHSFDASTIDAIIMRIEAEHELKIGMLVVDSPEHQRSIVPKKEHFLAKSMPYWDLKALARMRGIVNFVTFQRKVDQNINKRGRKKVDHVPEPEEAAGSVEIPRVLDYILTIDKPSESDKLLGRNKVWASKSRNVERPTYPIYLKRSRRSLRMTLTDKDPLAASAPASDNGGPTPEDPHVGGGRKGFGNVRMKIKSEPEEDE